MDLRRLGLFVAVVEHGGFTAAARAVHVAQPAVSLAVKELEQELGAELLVRSRAGVELTPAGEALLEPARQVLRDVEVAAAGVAAVTGLLGGRLDVATLTTLAADVVAPAAGRFLAAHPAVTLAISAPAEPEELAAAVRSGRVEVGVTEQGPANRGLVEEPAGTQELVALGPPGSNPARGRRLDVRALAHRPLVLTPPGTSLRAALDEALAAAGAAAATVAVETEVRDALVALVLAGAGTAVLPEGLAGPGVARGAVARRLRPPLRRDVVVVHRPTGLSPAAAAFTRLATSRVI